LRQLQSSLTGSRFARRSRGKAQFPPLAVSIRSRPSALSPSLAGSATLALSRAGPMANNAANAITIDLNTATPSAGAGRT
jgi:hypothetical protein